MYADVSAFVQAYADYYTMMDLSEELIRACADAVNGQQNIEYQGESLDLGKPFRRATMHDLVKEATGRAYPEKTVRSPSGRMIF